MDKTKILLAAGFILATSSATCILIAGLATNAAYATVALSFLLSWLLGLSTSILIRELTEIKKETIIRWRKTIDEAYDNTQKTSKLAREMLKFETPESFVDEVLEMMGVKRQGDTITVNPDDFAKKILAKYVHTISKSCF